ncbi:putative lipoprotein [Arthrobacter sp. Rue61a]|nr:putative lipoprotein [Arthrobacter sp. Rue61a]
MIMSDARTSRPRHFKAVAASLLLVTVAGGLSACREEKRPAPPYPAVEWQGTPPSAPIEADPWVIAARKSLEAQAVAQNITDFTLPELVETTALDLRVRLSRHPVNDVTQKRRPDIRPGPDPFLPMEVKPGPAAGTAEVRGCVVRWASETGDVPDEMSASGVMFRMEHLEAGQLRISSVVTLPDLDCSTATPPIALFVPAPEPSDVTDVQDVVRAKPAEIDPEYVDPE